MIDLYLVSGTVCRREKKKGKGHVHLLYEKNL